MGSTTCETQTWGHQDQWAHSNLIHRELTRDPSEILPLRDWPAASKQLASTQTLTLYRPLTWTSITANWNLLEITLVSSLTFVNQLKLALPPPTLWASGTSLPAFFPPPHPRSRWVLMSLVFSGWQVPSLYLTPKLASRLRQDTGTRDGSGRPGSD